MILRSIFLAVAAATTLALGSGCCLPHPCGYRCGVGPGICGSPCGGEVTGCATPTTCGDCGACDDCIAEPAPCCSPNACFGPGSLFRPFFGCNGGCGELYWSEWFSDPPEHCEPCDNYGNWVGTGCCVPRLGRIWSGLWGQPCYRGPGRCAPGMTTGCGSPMCCEAGPTVPGEPVMPAPRIVPGSPADAPPEVVPVPEPTPNPKPATTTTARRTSRHFYGYGKLRGR